MRRAEHLHKTMTALRTCVEHCRREAVPLAALDSRLAELRNDPELSPDDISQIETLARRALAACKPLAAISTEGSPGPGSSIPCRP